MHTPSAVPPVSSTAELVARVRAAELGPNPARTRVSLGFLTQQCVRHTTRATGYRNHVLSLRVAEAVGSCAVEPGELSEETVAECVGAPVAELLDHALAPVRTAALDAYLMHARPHGRAAETVPIPAGSSLDKSLRRASAVVELLPLAPGRTVLVVGVVNSLLHRLRERGLRYLPCDLRGGRTEWDEPIHTDAHALLDDCDAVLASGMTLGNETFEPLLRRMGADGRPLVVFAQTASAVYPHFLGAGLTALSAEPYPFFWLDGGPSTLYRYRARPRSEAPE